MDPLNKDRLCKDIVEYTGIQGSTLGSVVKENNTNNGDLDKWGKLILFLRTKARYLISCKSEEAFEKIKKEGAYSRYVGQTVVPLVINLISNKEIQKSIPDYVLDNELKLEEIKEKSLK